MDQKRIRSLDEYEQLEVGDIGYVPLASVYLPVDSDNFGGEPKKYPLESILGISTSDRGQITNLLGYSVSQLFAVAFSSVPIEVTFKVFRYHEFEPGKWTKKKVNHYLSGSNWVTTTGFNITIDPEETLTGIIIEYEFKQV